MSERARVLREEADRLERQAGAWAAGETGERRVGAVLDRMVSERRALVLHDRLIRHGSAANIDHVAVTPGGVFIIDAKNWYGYVNATPDALLKDNIDQWRALEYGKDAAKIAKTVAGWLPVFPVVCLAGAARIMEPRRSADVTVLNIEDLEGYILAQPAKATPDSARDTYASLTELFPAQPSPGRKERRTAPAAVAPQRKQGQRAKPSQTQNPGLNVTKPGGWQPTRIDWPEYQTQAPSHSGGLLGSIKRLFAP